MKTLLSKSLVAIVMAWPLAAQAGEGGWGMPNLNPFASKPKPPTSARISDGSDGWQLPSMWPRTGTARRSTGPSTWQKMTTGTKAVFSKTADVLNPWDDAADEAPVVPSGRGSTFSRTVKQKPQQQSSASWLTSWWTADEKRNEPKTVSDFLAQPRPDP